MMWFLRQPSSRKAAKLPSPKGRDGWLSRPPSWLPQPRHGQVNPGRGNRCRDSCQRCSLSAPMRLWTIHPRYLDAKGLVALWREALLAQKVLRGQSRGYRHHPQLIRFKEQSNPSAAIASYLKAVHDEAARRGYHFDRRKIGSPRFRGKIVETAGQLLFEWQHLKRKLKQRDPKTHARQRSIRVPQAHPLFRIVRGDVREWERG